MERRVGFGMQNATNHYFLNFIMLVAKELYFLLQ